MKARGIGFYVWSCLAVWLVLMLGLFLASLLLDHVGLAGGGFYDLWADMVLPGLFLATGCGCSLHLGARLEAGRLAALREGIASGRAGSICPGVGCCASAQLWQTRMESAESLEAFAREEVEKLRARLARAQADESAKVYAERQKLLKERMENGKCVRALDKEIANLKRQLSEEQQKARGMSSRLYLAGSEINSLNAQVDRLTEALVVMEERLTEREDRIVELESQLDWAWERGVKHERVLRKHRARACKRRVA